MKITTKMWTVLTTESSITTLETTVRMETTVSTTVGIDYCQNGNRFQDRDPCQDEDDQNQQTALKYT